VSRSMSRAIVVSAIIVLTPGCAASPPAPVAADAAAAPEPVVQVVADKPASVAVVVEEPERPVPQEIPADCADDGDASTCTPGTTFAKRMCKSTYPDIALALFHGKTPWSRAYVRQDMEAWYASARRSRPFTLKYAEEVIVLASRVPSTAGGVSVSGGGSYDVVRWDGTCVSLMEGELSFRAPSTPDVAEIRWRRLNDDITRTLEKDRRIAFRNGKRREACRADRDERRCARAKSQLSQMIATYVRGGGDLPTPKMLP
jgi:hypothetical protein